MSKMRISKDGLLINIQPVEGNRLEELNRFELGKHSIYLAESDEDEMPTYIVGDLHGNALKLLTVLYLSGVIQYDTVTHKKWSDLYYKSQPNIPLSYLITRDTTPENKSKIQKEHKKWHRPSSFDSDIQKILKALIWNKNFQGQIVLCGDQVHDRGRSDYMTLSLMHQLSTHGINWTYICGNHDQALVMACTGGWWLADQDPKSSRNSWMASSNQACSWDYGLLDSKHQKNMQVLARSALKHMKMVEIIPCGDNTIVCSHAPLPPDMLPSVYNQLATILGQQQLPLDTPMSRLLISGINTLFQAAAFGSNAEQNSLSDNFDADFTFPYAERTRCNTLMCDARASSAIAALIQTRNDYTNDFTTYYPTWINVYGHTGSGSLDDLGKTASKVNNICLDTRLGKRNERNNPAAVARFTTSPERIETSEDNLERDKGPLLICSVKPDLKDNVLKFRQMRSIIMESTGAYMEWWSQVPAAMTADVSDESDVAAMMQAEASRAKTSADIREILRKWAKNQYPFTPTRGELFPLVHIHDLASFILDSINSHYPPINLAVRIGSAKILPQSFMVDYGRARPRDEIKGTDEIKAIKDKARQYLATHVKSS